jgi:ABC-type nitrate/sulfonate/bicarbonate transport system permease component
MKNKIFKPNQSWILIAIIVTFTTILSYFFGNQNSNYSIFPNPILIFKELIKFNFGTLLFDSLITLAKTLVAFVLSFLICFLFIFVTIWHQQSAGVVRFLSHSLKNYPSIAIFPFVSLLFGLGELSQILVGCVAASLLKISTISQKIHSSSNRLNIMKRYYFSKFQYFQKIVVPQVIEFAFEVSSSSLAICYVVIIVLELSFTNYSGLGYELNLAKNNLNTQLMWVWLILIGLIGYVLSLTLQLVSKKVVYWK